MTTRRQTERAIEMHADQLSAFANVVGIGMSETADADGRSSERSLAIGVYVSDKKPASELSSEDLLPGFVEIDDGGDLVKVPVKVIEMGELHPEAGGSDDTENQRNEGDDGSTFFPQ